MSEAREVVFFECDHMRPVVQVDGEWRHIIENGRVSRHPCGCSHAFRQTARSVDQHYLTSLIQPEQSGKAEGFA